MARTNVYTCLCMQANRCKHVRTFLIGYRSGGTPCIFASRGACWNCGPSTREQCLPAPQQPPGSSCCPSLLAGGFRLITNAQGNIRRTRLSCSFLHKYARTTFIFDSSISRRDSQTHLRTTTIFLHPCRFCGNGYGGRPRSRPRSWATFLKVR